MRHSPDEDRPSASLDALRRRAEIVRRLRAFFEQRGFLEVETPVLSRDTVVDRHLDPLSVCVYSDPRAPGEGPAYFLQTSPEFAMKRLLAAHGTSIFQITRAFRAGELGPLHNPEFTMVEWYEVGADMRQGMRTLSDLAETILERGEAELRSYADAFRQVLRIDPHTCSLEALRHIAMSREPAPPESLGEDRDGWLEWLFVTCLEPQLGITRPVIIYDYPASQAALAQVRGTSPAVAERFELFVDGVELANGYHELLDASVLRERAAANNAYRIQEGKQALPEENRLLTAMQRGMPPSAGVALGLDRLVMVAIGAKRISDVMAFDFPRA